MMIGPITGPAGFLEFAENIAALAIPGVVRDYGLAPPMSLSTAGLPAKYLSSARGTGAPIVFCEGEGSKMMVLSVIIAIEPHVQSIPEANKRNTLQMMDDAYVEIMEADLALSRVVNLEIRQDIVPMAGVEYWAVVAEITARG